MATSSKVRFRLDELRTKALEVLDLRIVQAQTEVDSYDNEEALAELVTQWREKQEEKISRIFAQLGEGGVDDYRLAQFSLDPIPNVDRYAVREATRNLERLIVRRAQVEAKVSSLIPEEDGGISLTKTQLADFFGL